MSNYILSCCSTADMSKEYFISRDIHYICFHYYLDGKEYFDDLGESMDIMDFYKKMQEGADTKTSQVNADEFIEYFEPFLKEGKDIIHLTLSSGISGVYNSAMIARDTLMDMYPSQNILIVDSLAASSGYGLLIDKLADLRDAGKSLNELYTFAETHKKEIHHWFFSTDLTFFIKGGRISKAAGFIGGVLNICPLLNVDTDGKLVPRQKIRTKKKVIAELISKMESLAKNGVEYSDKCFLSHSACYEDALEVATQIELRFPKLKGKVQIQNVGTTIGSHTGPGTVALFFWGKERDLS